MLCVAGVPNTTKEILKIPIFGIRGSADSRRAGIIRLIDFNRFGVVVSRRAGIIRLIDLGVDGLRKLWYG